MFRYIIFFPGLSYFLAYEIISRITYSTPDVLSETFKCEIKYKEFPKINAYALSRITFHLFSRHASLTNRILAARATEIDQKLARPGGVCNKFDTNPALCV